MATPYKAAFLTWTDETGSAKSFKFDAVTSEQHVLTSEIASHPVEAGIAIADNVNQNADEVTLEGIVSETPIVDLGERFQLATLDLGLANRKLLVPATYPLTYPNTTLKALTRTGPLGVLFNAFDLASRPQSYGGSAYNGSANPLAKSVRVLQATKEFTAVPDALAVLRALKEKATLIRIYSPRGSYVSMILTNVTTSVDPDGGAAASFSLTLQNVRIVSSKIVAAPKPSELRAKVDTSKGAQPAKPPTTSIAKGIGKVVGKLAGSLIDSLAP